MRDKQIEKLIQAEKKRQKSVINLIASENYVSDDVLRALGSELTNKYAEGYPGRRYYGGNEIIDKIEKLAQSRALKLFGLTEDKWGVNVQVLSGSPANFAVYSTLVPIGGKIMGMKLISGGHLTHGHKVSMTGKLWTQVSYGLDPKTERLNFEEIEKIALENKPDIIVAGFTAYPRIIDWKKFRQIADKVGAILMVDMSHLSGLVAGKVYPSPFSTKGGQALADVVTTTTHKPLRGPRAALIFSRKLKIKNSPPKADPPSAEKSKTRNPKSTLADLIDKTVFPGLQGGPHLNQIAAVAVALKEAMNPKFKKYAKQIIKNAHALSGELGRLGWRIVSGGTDTHLLLVDTWLNGNGIGGAEASDRLERAGIIVNKNAIPFDTRSPMDPSGIRLGTAA